ncbi:MAG TPA: hypothetical protein DD458_15375 [Prolixibacteraceae bacterium]|nr:hypothetical protein [Prolixibacteraceae bacterium]HCU61241.1 hypothetical protein [Prolixibacteraceae bacterium]
MLPCYHRVCLGRLLSSQQRQPVKFAMLKKSIIAITGTLLILFLMFPHGCKKGQETEEEITPVEIDLFAPVLNEPGPPIVPKSGDFTVAVIPDTQYYTASKNGGTPKIFESQINWIKNNQEKENIVYVIHLGDMAENGDNPAYAHEQWFHAKSMMYKLENPVSIPYGIAVGNHDQYPSQYPVTGTTNYYNKYFGVKHFGGRSYYGGHYDLNNDSHYDLFSAGDNDFIVIYIEYDAFNEDQGSMNNWAYNLLTQYSTRKAIIVSHYLIGNNGSSGTNNGDAGTFRSQGQAIYDRLKYCPNVFMMLCGHVGDNGEGYRNDTFQGNTIHTFLSDYQSRENGGNGLMRLYRFSIEKKLLEVKTLSSVTNECETDGDSQFAVTLFN